MDENQNQTNQPTEALQTSVSPVPETNTTDKKSLLGLAVLLILILAGIVGISLLTNKKPTPNAPTTSKETIILSPTITPTVEEELDQVTLESPDQDFVDIEADLNQL